MIFGDPEEVIAKLGGSTAYIERTHLTMRHMNGRLVCKGLGFSKVREMRQQHPAVSVVALARVHRSSERT